MATEVETEDAPVGCDWPMFGQSPERSFNYPCDTEISPETVTGLQQAWFFNTDDVVTASPAVYEGTVYAGDWSGKVYAIDLETGEQLWTFQVRTHPLVYSGQIVSSPAVAEIEGRATLFVAGGKTMHALDARTGEEIWARELGTPGDETETTEIQSSPVLADGKLIFGFDAHDRPGLRAGVLALDPSNGEVIWDFDPDAGGEPSGCAGVWSSPTVDLDRRLVFFGTANCPTSPEGWTTYSEAIVAIELDTGQPAWSFQPHDPNNNDLDFAGAPNLFETGGRAAVGLGNKDGRYYAVERETGELIWQVTATEPTFEEGSNYSFGGFIGATATDGRFIAGGTAGQGATACPCLHGIDAETGELAWKASEPQPIYGPSAIAGGVLFAGGTDFTFRAIDLASGEVLWSRELGGAIAGGAAIAGNDVIAVSGLRQPGGGASAESAGVYRFTLDATGAATTTSTTAAVEYYSGPVQLAPTDQPCVGDPCEFTFDFPAPPDGLTPTGSLMVTTDPFSFRIEARGMGDPGQWVAPNAPDASEGADVFVGFLATSDERPIGTLICTFDDNGVCETATIPQPAPRFERWGILALPSGAEFPSIAEGVARLVYTTRFAEPLVVLDPPTG